MTVDEHAAYALHLSEAERNRYRMMARSLEREAGLLRDAGVVPGAHVVDMGCGPGAVLVELARLVSPGGRVVGVEPNAAARAAALEEIAAAGLENAAVVEGSGTASGLEAGAWDVVMMRHVLFHVGAMAPAVVRHAADLVRPGGHVYLVDVDGTALRLEPSEPDAEESRRRYQEFQRSRGNNTTIGPRLHVLLASAGLEIIAVDAWYNVVTPQGMGLMGPVDSAAPAMIAEGMLTEAEAERFLEARRRTAQDPLARLFVPHFVAVGRKPG